MMFCTHKLIIWKRRVDTVEIFTFQEKGSCSMVENVCCKVKITLVLMNCVQNCNNYLL